MKKRTIPLPLGDNPILDFEANASQLVVVPVEPGEAPCLEGDPSTDPEVLLVCYNRIIKCQDRIRLDATTRRPSLTPPPLTDGAVPPAALQLNLERPLLAL